MKVKPMIGDWEIPRIESIHTYENRRFVELAIPGKLGSLYQDMHNNPMSLVIVGSLYGEESNSIFLETVREKFNAGDPVTFIGDIVTATEVQYVLIESLQLKESSHRPDQIDYAIVIKESPPPPPPPNPLGELDTGLLDDAGSFLDSVTNGLDLLDSLGSVPDISDPTPPLSDALSGVEAATEGLEASLSPLTEIFGTL